MHSQGFRSRLSLKSKTDVKRSQNLMKQKDKTHHSPVFSRATSEAREQELLIAGAQILLLLLPVVSWHINKVAVSILGNLHPPSVPPLPISVFQ